MRRKLPPRKRLRLKQKNNTHKIMLTGFSVSIQLVEKVQRKLGFCRTYGIMYMVMTVLEKNVQIREQVEIICLEDLNTKKKIEEEVPVIILGMSMYMTSIMMK